MKAKRHDQLLELLVENEAASVSELASRLGVSEVTMRRDLLQLEADGYLKRVHGGAVRAGGRSFGRPYRLREGSAVQRKQAIAAAAAELVCSGDAIALDGGSTVTLMINYLGHVNNLTIVTANLRTAWEVSQARALAKPLKLIIAGGSVRPDELSVSGMSALEQCRNLRVDMAFIGVAGVEVHAGFTDYDYDDAAVKRAIIQGARRVVALADSSKIGVQTLAVVADLPQVDLLITDDAADPSAVVGLEQAGLHVQQVVSGTDALDDRAAQAGPSDEGSWGA